MPYLGKQILSGSASLSFNLASGSASNTITVAGASVGDGIGLGLPNDSNAGQMLWVGRVSAANTVNITATDLQATGVTISGTFRVWVFKP
jgi:hypothetical protein